MGQTTSTTGSTTVWRLLALAVALAVATVGCGDPMADKLEASGKQPYSDDDPPLPTEGYVPTTTAPAPASVPVDPAAAPSTAPTTTTAPPAEPAPEREEFVAEIEASCAARGRQIGSAALNSGASSPQDALRLLRQMLADLDTTMTLLRTRTPPAGDEATVADLIGGLEHVASKMRPPVEAGGFRSEAERADYVRVLEVDGPVVAARFDAYGLPSCF